MFATASLAARIERAECGSIEEMARAATARIGDDVVVRPIGGGLAVYAGPDSPVNKLAGLGFAPVPAVSELEAIEQEFARRGAPLQVEFATLGDPAIPRMLTGRGYDLIGFENVMGLRLEAVGACCDRRCVDPRGTCGAGREHRVDGCGRGWLPES